MKLLAARTVVCSAERVLHGGGVLVEGGRVRRVAASRAALRRLARSEALRIEELGEGVLTAGLVNAHAHLELTALGGLSAEGGFLAWVGRVLAARAAASPGRLERGISAGARELLAGGTTSVGDVDSSGSARRVLASSPIRAVVFREALDAGAPARTGAVLEACRRRGPVRATCTDGYSPHGPHTASPALLEGVSRLAAERGWPVQVHWAESPQEVDWLRSGTGPFAALLGESPRTTGLSLLERSGLLGARTSLVHGNHPGRGELGRVARAGATLVHCPGSHAWFGRAPFDPRSLLRAGGRLALGTDSATSNAALDMRREMALLSAACPGLDPGEVWRAATESGARPLGLEGEIGVLQPGARADLALFEVEPEQPAGAVLPALVSSLPAVRSVWVGGRRVSRSR